MTRRRIEKPAVQPTANFHGNINLLVIAILILLGVAVILHVTSPEFYNILSLMLAYIFGRQSVK